jgi:hypothetical protein
MTEVFESAIERQLNFLKGSLEVLASDEAKTKAQYYESDDEVKKSRLKRSIDRIYEDMKRIEQEIREIEGQSSDPNRQYLNLEQLLPKLDFDEVMDDVDELVKAFRRDRKKDALLLVQENLAMAGDLCLLEVRERLKQVTGDFKHIPIEFSDASQFDSGGFLEGLAGYLDIPIEQTAMQLTQAVLDKLSGSVQSGSIVFLEIRKWDDVPCQEAVFTWFIDEFWQPLLQRVRLQTSTCPKVRVVGVIVVDYELSPECFEHPCWKEESQAPTLLKLELRDWTADDVQNWLESYMGIGNPRSSQLAQRIHRGSRGGTPEVICTALRKEFLR